MPQDEEIVPASDKPSEEWENSQLAVYFYLIKGVDLQSGEQETGDKMNRGQCEAAHSWLRLKYDHLCAWEDSTSKANLA